MIAHQDAQLTYIRDQLQGAKNEAALMRADLLVYLISMALAEVKDIEKGLVRRR